jgi:hypothetical protein
LTVSGVWPTGLRVASVSGSASLAGRAFEIFPLYVALRAEPMLAVDTLTTLDLLAFAGLGPVRVPALPLERQVAEKLRADTRTYEGDRPSSGPPRTSSTWS